MKKVKKCLLLAALSILFFSCSKLEEEPYSFFTPDQFYKTSADVQAGITAVYGPLASLYNQVGWQMPNYIADQMFPRAVVGRDQLPGFTFDPSFAIVTTYWANCYQGISNANALLKNIEGVSMDATLKSQIKAEAHFMRALFYFNLARSYGDVPIRLEPVTGINESLGIKAPVKDVYALILSDLEIAERDLPAAPAQRGRAFKGAAIALAAKAYLYTENWNKASAKALQLITNPGTLGLVSRVKDLWDVDKEDANRKEFIFAVEFSRLPGLVSSEINGFFAPGGSAPIFNKVAYGSQFAYLSFFNSFNNNDERKSLMATSYVNTAGKLIDQTDPNLKGRAFITKFTDPQSNGAAGENNYPILRFADVLLIHAEAEARLNGANAAAYESVNKVRRRAFGQPLNLPSIYDITPGLIQTNFINAVLQERSFELCFEGDRWYDLTRNNRFLEVASVTNAEYALRPVQAKHRWFPIPLSEVQTNSRLEQNPLWK